MKKFILIIVIALVVYCCGAISKHNSGNSLIIKKVGITDTTTVNVKGKIIDEYEKFGLKWASIELNSALNSYSQRCVENGIFHFKNVKAGNYEVIGNAAGYYLFKDSINLKSGEILDLTIGLVYDE